jgi:trimeric autotransporter adhesin
MKTRITLIVAAFFGVMFTAELRAQSTAFTYQGQLTSGANPASGSYDFRFRIAADPLGNSFIGGPLLTNAVPVAGGLFTVTLDFGAGIFTGANYWLQVDVKTNGAVSYTTLTPLQNLTPTPHAIFANTAGNLSGTLNSEQLSGEYSGAVTFNNAANNFTGSGAGLTSLNASQLDSGTVPAAALGNAWKTGGNAATTPGTHFLGTTDTQPLELKVDGQRVLRFERDTNAVIFGFVIPNIIGGHESNVVAHGTGGATIAGGGGPDWFGATPPHTVSGLFGTIGGGVGNIVHASVGVIAGGERGFIATNGFNAAIGGGAANSIESGDSTISGGRNNRIRTNALRATISGGINHTIQTNASYSTIAGGSANTIQISASFATIGGGGANTIQTNAWDTTIGGGWLNTIQADAQAATIGGGNENLIQANAQYATIPGGRLNSAASSAFAAGTRAKANHTGAFVWADSTDQNFASTAANQFLVRAAGGVGIGTASPGAALDVRTTSGTGNAIRFGYYTGGEGNLIAGPSRVGIATGDMVERISIPQSTGNVGLGTLSPSQKLHVIGNILASGSITPNSDVNAKTDFAPVNVAEILERVATLSLHQWRFKDEPDGVKHIGPMAQDFRAAFGLGEIPTAIATVDADGVALAAIQGLNQKLEQKSAEITELKQSISELKELVGKLTRMLDGDVE